LIFRGNFEEAKNKHYTFQINPKGYFDDGQISGTFSSAPIGIIYNSDINTALTVRRENNVK